MFIGTSQAKRKFAHITASTDLMSLETDDLDTDEVDLAILDLISMGEDYGISPSQMLRLIRDRVTVAAEIADMAADTAADDELPTRFH